MLYNTHMLFLSESSVISNVISGPYHLVQHADEYCIHVLLLGDLSVISIVIVKTVSSSTTSR